VPLSTVKPHVRSTDLSSYGSRLSEGQAGGAGVLSDQMADDGLVDVTDLTLADLRDLGDNLSYLAPALSRLVDSSRVEGHLGFQSRI
jgi:hypothetical protein